MADSNVIPGTLKSAFTTSASNKPLTVQITNLKEIVNETGKRLRFILNDGEYSCHAVCRPEDATRIEALGIQKSSIVEVITYTAELMGSADKKKHILVISDAKLIHATFHRIGAGKSISVDDYFRAHPAEDVRSNERQLPAPVTTAAAPLPSAPSKTYNNNSNANAQRSNGRPKRAPEHLFAIDQLSPYQNLWTIKARVSYKSPMRTWSNQKGEGKLFNVNFLDETNEIRATAFNDMADKLFDVLQEGKVFYISKARINPARPQFSNLKHPYELGLDRDTEITECEDASDVPKLHYNFVPLSKVQDLDVNSVIDVIAVIKEINPAFQITSKSTGRPYDRRDIVLVDESQFAVTLGLWNKMAVDFSLPVNSVVAVKGARVQEFGGRSLSLSQSGTVSPNPDTPEAFKLKGWYDTQGVSREFKSIKQETMGGKNNITGDRKTIAQAQDEHLGENEKPDYFNIKATINFVKSDNFCYPACKSEGCNRKVIEQPDGLWRCEKCDVNHPEPRYRYILSCSVVDHTGQVWVTFFDETAQVVLGLSANELHRAKEEEMDNGKFVKIMEDVQMREYSFRLSARQDNYNGVARIRYNVQQVAPLDFNSECDSLVSSLDELLLRA